LVWAAREWRAWRRAAGGAAPVFRLFKEDVRGAYRTLPLPAGERALLGMLICDEESADPWYVEQRTCPFGARGSVWQWDRVGRAVVESVRHAFCLVCGRYVDDFFVLEEEELLREAQEVFRWALQRLGIPLDPGKAAPKPDCPRTEEIELLGCEVVFVDAAGAGTWQMRMGPSEAKCREWAEQLRDCLRRGHLSSGEASKVAGRLSWAATWTWGQVGRAFVRPLFNWPGGALSKRLRRALRWWVRRLGEPVLPRVVDLDVGGLPGLAAVEDARPDFLLYTDAEGSGGLGAVLWELSTGRQWWFSWRVRGAELRFLPRQRTRIILLEALATVLAQEVWGSLIAGRRVRAFGDNAAAVGAFIKGASPKAHLSAVAEVFWARQWFWRPAQLWLGRVASKDNPADAPSRGRLPPGGGGEELPGPVQEAWFRVLAAVRQAYDAGGEEQDQD
jgi:hypothetical protein